MPLYIAFIDISKAFDQVHGKAVFAILLLIGCLSNLLNIRKSFNTNTKVTVQYDGNVSESFTIGKKQGWVLSPSFFGFYFLCAFSAHQLRELNCIRDLTNAYSTLNVGKQLKSKIVHRTRSAIWWWWCIRGSLCPRSTDTIESVFLRIPRTSSMKKLK